MYCGYFGVINTGLCVLLGQKSFCLSKWSHVAASSSFSQSVVNGKHCQREIVKMGGMGSPFWSPDDGSVGSP